MTQRPAPGHPLAACFSRALNIPRIDVTANSPNDGRLFSAGGCDAGATGGVPQSYSSIEGYSRSFGRRCTLSNSLAFAGFDHTATNLLDDSLITAGGSSTAG